MVRVGEEPPSFSRLEGSSSGINLPWTTGGDDGGFDAAVCMQWQHLHASGSFGYFRCTMKNYTACKVQLQFIKIE